MHDSPQLTQSCCSESRAKELDALIAEAEDKLVKVGSKTRYYCEDDEYCTDIALKASRDALKDAGVKAERILIASGERSFDWADFTCKTPGELVWKFASLTIGDGAGALVVEKSEDDRYAEDPHHFQFFYRIFSEQFNTCTIGLNYYCGERYRLYSHSKNLIKAGRKATVELIEQMLRDADAYIEGKKKAFFPNFGNVGSASLPIAMCLAQDDGKLKPGNRIFVVVPAAGVQCGIMSFRY